MLGMNKGSKSSGFSKPSRGELLHRLEQKSVHRLPGLVGTERENKLGEEHTMVAFKRKRNKILKKIKPRMEKNGSSERGWGEGEGCCHRVVVVVAVMKPSYDFDEKQRKLTLDFVEGLKKIGRPLTFVRLQGLRKPPGLCFVGEWSCFLS